MSIYIRPLENNGKIRYEMTVKFRGGVRICKSSYNYDDLFALQSKLIELRVTGTSYEDAKQFMFDYSTPQIPQKISTPTIPPLPQNIVMSDTEGRVLSVITENNQAAFYMEHLPINRKKYLRRELFSRAFGVFANRSGEAVYIDMWDLLGNRKPFIPVRRVKLKNKPVWVQTDKDVRDLFPCVKGIVSI